MMILRPSQFAISAVLVVLMSGPASLCVTPAAADETPAPSPEKPAPVAGDEPAAAKSDSDAKQPDKELSVPRQPGDDATRELKDPLRKPDGAKKRAMAAYMAGVAAQKNGKLDDALKAYAKAAEADPTAAEPVKAHALLLMRLGRIEQAEQMARKAIELDKNDFETRIQLAILMLASRDPAAAATLIEEALNSTTLKHNSPQFVSIHSVRGRLYIQVGDAGKAAESYKVILSALERPEDFGLDFREHQKLMTDRVTGYDTVGKVMLEVGRYDDAKSAFSALARVNEDRPGEYHYWLALTQYRMDELDKAIKNLDRYFETNERSRDSLQLLSDLYDAKSESLKVTARLEELAVDTNDAVTVKLFLGDRLVNKGDTDAATKVYREIIDSTADADAYLGLIRVDIAKQDAASLLKSVQKALRARIQIQELAPLLALIANDPGFGKKVVDEAVASLQDSATEQHPTATFFYSELATAESLDLPEQEEALLKATLDQNPELAVGIEAMTRLGRLQYLQDKPAEAVDTFRKLLAVPGLPANNQAMALYLLAAAEEQNKNYEGAIEVLQSALKLAPENPLFTYQLGWTQLRAEKLSDAEQTLKQAVQHSVARGDTERQGASRLLLAALYTQMARWDEAIAEYNELLSMPEITPEHLRRGRTALSNAYVQKGDMKNGERILEEVYAESPDDPGVNNDLGYLYAEQNKKLEQAEKMIQIAVKAEPDNPAYLDSLGWVLYRLGKHEEALEALTKATSDPDYRDSTIIDHLGDVQKALGQMDEAKKSWQEALEVEQKAAIPDQSVVDRLTKKLAE